MDLPDARARLAVAAGAAAASMAAYLATLGSGPFWQDAGLFLGALARGGGLVPPGYPVWLILGRPFVKAYLAVLPGHTFARAVHTFDALWGASAAALTTLSVALLVTPGYRFFGAPSGKAGKRPAPAVEPRLDLQALAVAGIAGALGGLSYSLWSQAVNAEAYALNGFFAALVLFLVLRLGAEGALGRAPTPRQRQLLYGVAVAHGLSCGNHPDIVVFVPALACLVWMNRAAFLANRGLALRVFGAWALAGLLPYAYLPWAAARHPGTLYDHVRDLRSFVAHVSGSQWTAAEESYGWSTDRLRDFPAMLWQELFATGLASLALGLALLARRDRPLLVFLLVFMAVAFALPVFYQQGGEYDMWLIPLYLAATVVAGVGLHALAVWAARFMSARFAVVLLAVATLAPPVAVNGPLLDRRQDFVPVDFALNLFRHIAPGAVLLAWSDQECSLTWYLQTVESHRSDVTVVAAPMLTMPWYRDWVRKNHRTLVFSADAPGAAPSTPDEVLARLLLENAGRVFYTSKRPAVVLPGGAAWVPAGGLWKLDAAHPGAVDLGHWEYVYRNPDPFARPARRHAPLKATDPKTGAPTVARTPYTHQIRLFHAQAWKNLGDWRLGREEWTEAAEAYQRVFDLDAAIESADLLFRLGKALFATDREQDAAFYLRKATLLAPGLAEAWLYLGQIDARRGDRASADAAFDAVRRLAPDLWRQNEAALRQAGMVQAGMVQ